MLYAPNSISADPGDIYVMYTCSLFFPCRKPLSSSAGHSAGVCVFAEISSKFEVKAKRINVAGCNGVCRSALGNPAVGWPSRQTSPWGLPSPPPLPIHPQPPTHNSALLYTEHTQQQPRSAQTRVQWPEKIVSSPSCIGTGIHVCIYIYMPMPAQRKYTHVHVLFTLSVGTVRSCG